MTIAETPIEAIMGGNHRTTGDGVHLVARNYRKGTRLDTHMHREAQLVYAATRHHAGDDAQGPLAGAAGPGGLGPCAARTFDRRARRCRRCGRCISIWPGSKREARSASLDAEFVVRVSPLLHQAILALFDDSDDPGRTGLLIKLAMLELHQAEDSATFIPLPHEPRCRRAADIVLARSHRRA